MSLSQLTEVGGDLPEACQDRIQDLPSADLEKLAKALLRFHSFGDLQSWLERHDASNV